MADPKKKPGLVLAIGLGKKPKSEEPPMSDDTETEESDDFDSAASNAFDALKEDDLEGFKAALKLAVMSCKSEDY